MENPIKNKETASVFARYLKNKYGWTYNVVLPEEKDQPYFDVRLDSAKREELLLQMKQIIHFDEKFVKKKRGEAGMGIPGKDWKAFSSSPDSIEKTIKNAEEKYKEGARHLILILHSDEGYLIKKDAELIDKDYFKKSNFRGIYMVSPVVKLWGVCRRTIKKEFVYEIKNAFAESL